MARQGVVRVKIAFLSICSMTGFFASQKYNETLLLVSQQSFRDPEWLKECFLSIYLERLSPSTMTLTNRRDN